MITLNVKREKPQKTMISSVEVSYFERIQTKDVFQDNGNVEDKERMKVLMQRLKQLEAENSALVLESEQQRGQYDKCLDEIANQVVQALLSQKV